MKEQELKRLNAFYADKMAQYFGSEEPMVFGDGNPNAGIVLVGEAPGRQEVRRGKPFVGQAGKNLDEFIEILEIERDALYITNTVKIRPVRINPDTGREANRAPTREEVGLFTEFLGKELGIIAPRLVVSLGNIALRCILGDEGASIGALHGTLLDAGLSGVPFKLFPLYHPASIIYRPELKPAYIADLHKLKEYMAFSHIKP